MREFEISIKSDPHGAQVRLDGYTKDLIMNFAVLAHNLSKRSGVPLDFLAELVRHGDELTDLIVKGGIGIDLSAIKQARGEK